MRRARIDPQPSVCTGWPHKSLDVIARNCPKRSASHERICRCRWCTRTRTCPSQARGAAATHPSCTRQDRRCRFTSAPPPRSRYSSAGRSRRPGPRVETESRIRTTRVLGTAQCTSSASQSRARQLLGRTTGSPGPTIVLLNLLKRNGRTGRSLNTLSCTIWTDRSVRIRDAVATADLCYGRIRFGDVLLVVQTDTDNLLRVGNRRSDPHVLGMQSRTSPSNHVACRRERLLTYERSRQPPRYRAPACTL